ncbi:MULTISPECIES: lysozyme [unclassified Acinetobacter]|uniref:lysozyme n=1 Tax=unclassified Acinetobacter TaxID=196816 RepID=UPI00244D6ED2|nr:MULTISPECIES: lysozyme [unclassified Acinetobacter]MDH0030300.1 lysozyme [Acinetobacter sp. GD04021]MDH0885868.1 lysozyme [Acinetobacter sp. GD03873]MDH1082488.1 lysozyme [Acinetobacter sp. GD03983]MDH2189120.1 lysozyme [Acinetobacter sp. GD03645]MDH2202308.1 lysozyme [Acinetobacter sp. GD03647]
MTINQSEQIAQAYSWLRAMSGGKLAQEQVDAGDAIIALNGLSTFAKLIGFKLDSTVTGQRDISENGFSIIREFEGFRSQAYLDTGGVWTIGYGTIKYPNGTRVKKGDTCTQAQAELWLKNDCAWVDSCLDKYVTITISQNQFDALASFVYNIGETAFVKSTMLKALNAGNFAGTAMQFDRWVYDNGKCIQGLVNRREKEKTLFLKK